MIDGMMSLYNDFPRMDRFEYWVSHNLPDTCFLLIDLGVVDYIKPKIKETNKLIIVSQNTLNLFVDACKLEFGESHMLYDPVFEIDVDFMVDFFSGIMRLHQKSPAKP